MPERTLRNGGHVTSLPSPERIEVIVHLNGRDAQCGVFDIARAIVWSDTPDPIGMEPVDKGGVRYVYPGVSVTVYP